MHSTMPPALDIQTRTFEDLQHLDIHAEVSTFIKSNQDKPLVKAIVALVDAIQAKLDLPRLVKELLSTLSDPNFYTRLYDALKMHMEAHPWLTAFFIIGVVLMCNPLAVAGFGSLGPVAGSLATAWQSSLGGSVAAGSAFSILQSWGMTHSIIIPVAGAAIAAGSVVAVAAGDQIAKSGQDALAIANAGGKEVEKWNRGDYGDPVTQWWNGAYGDPVARWWKGEYGTPVAHWANAVIKKN